jgi:hypothetical protein
MAAKQAATVEVPAKSSGGSAVGRKLTAAVIVIGGIWVVLQVGVPTVVNFLDPGGSGGLLDRLPHMVRNAGVAGLGVGAVVSLIRPWKELGHHLFWYGLGALMLGLLGPTALVWLSDHGPAIFSSFLQSLGNVKGISLK